MAYVVGVATTVRPRVRADGKLRPPRYVCLLAEEVRAGGGTLILFDPADAARRDPFPAWTPVDPARPFAAWRRVVHPWPDAVYENAYVHLAVAGYCRGMRMAARARRCPVFNPVLPGKWRMVKLLQAAGLAAYLPETHRLAGADQAARWIDGWGAAYVKPVGGFGGMGVAKVERRGGRYLIRMDRVPGRRGRLCREVDRAGLLRWLASRRRVPHLVQQAVPLLCLRGRAVDFRVVVQRDGEGRWQLVGIIPKWAAKGGVVTNLVAGGERLSLAACERMARAEGKSVPSERLAACALSIAEALSRRHPACGLAGFDLGVDEDGRVYMIEMNPKPARSLLTDAMRTRSARLAARFLLYLASSRAEKPGGTSVVGLASREPVQ